MFVGGAKRDGEKRNGACILCKSHINANKIFQQNRKLVTMTQQQVLKRMKETQPLEHCNLQLNCQAFIRPDHPDLSYEPQGTYSLKHASGWKITGVAHSDWFCFCDTFKAVHRTLGQVWADQMTDKKSECLMASSVKAMDSFWHHHGESFEITDYGDI